MSGLVRDLYKDEEHPVGIDLYLFLMILPTEPFHLHLRGERALCGAINVEEAVLHLFHTGCSVLCLYIQGHRTAGHPKGVFAAPFLQFLQVLSFQSL